MEMVLSVSRFLLDAVESLFSPLSLSYLCYRIHVATTTALGRYGPFRKADRKSKDGAFDIKSFIFSHDPSEWAFAVQEKLFGREEQTIDITDDLTGKTHDIAKSHVPMYVNEVGHNKTLVQNVDALERHDRSIHYYINIREPMEKGDTVELLTDYLDSKY